MNNLLDKAFKISAAAFAVFMSNATLADQQIQDDLVVVGSECIGIDCVNGESFGFDTLRLKENNLRIRFMDTSSSSSFPSRDWQILINESANGGANLFGIEDIDAGTRPFSILASAPNNSIYISENGNVGFGTSTPLVDLSVKTGNSPTLRLEQDNSSGFSAQTWDVGGNETNFFIRDISNGSVLPFRINTGAPNSSIHIAADGDIGFQTSTPDGLLDVAHPSNANNHALLISPLGYAGINIDNGQLPKGLFDVQTTGGSSKFLVGSNGKVGINLGTSGTASGVLDIKNIASTASIFTVADTGVVSLVASSADQQLVLGKVAGAGWSIGSDAAEFRINDDNNVTRLSIDNDGLISGSFDFSSVALANLTLPEYLTVTGLTTLNGGATISGGSGFSVTGTSTFTGAVNVTGTLGVTGASTHSGGLTVSGGSGLAVTGSSLLTGGLKVTLDSIVDGNLAVGISAATSKAHINYVSGEGLLVENSSTIEEARSVAKFKNKGAVAIDLVDSSADGNVISLQNADGSTYISHDGSNIFTLTDAGKLTVADQICAKNGNNCIGGGFSSKYLKNIVSTVNSNEILDKVSELPISRWSYKNESSHIVHMGPMAEDFEAAFGLNGGVTDRITYTDINGVALASIQALHSELKLKNNEILLLNQQIEQQSQDIKNLQEQMLLIQNKLLND